MLDEYGRHPGCRRGRASTAHLTLLEGLCDAPRFPLLSGLVPSCARRALCSVCTHTAGDRLRRGEFITFQGDPMHRQYNEVVLDSRAWSAGLPRTIEAFFYPDTPQCSATPCQQAVRDARAGFAKEYDAEPLPLLRLRLQPDGTTPAFQPVS